MNRLRRSAVGLAAAVVGTFGPSASRAHADPTYSYFYVAGQASYTAAPNATLTVPLYLEEVSTDSSSLLGSEGGLSAAGVSVAVSGAGPTQITGIAGNVGTPPAGFDGTPVTTASTSTTASLLENTDITATTGVAAGPQANGVSLLLLGSLTVRTGSTTGQTTFVVSPYSSTSGNTFTNLDAYDLDNSSDPSNPDGSSDLYYSAAGTEFTVDAAVASPEPTSLLLAGSASAALALARRRPRSRRA